jgi:spore coat protein U-like protein
MKLLRPSLAALALYVIGSSVQAATVQATFNVSANVPTVCSISTAPGPLAFGTYTGATNLDASNSLGVTCVNGTTFRVYITTAGARQLTNGASVLNYELYLDSARTQVFPNTFAGATNRSGNGLAQTINIFGRVPLGQTPTVAGSHSQAATVVVEF